MKSAHCHLKSVTAYSQSRNIDKAEFPEKPRELKDDYERRTCRHRMHVTPDGFVEIPQVAFSGSIREAARRLQIPIPGKGKSLFTKNFEGGVEAFGALKTNVRAEDAEMERLFVPSDGKPGGGKRVWKWFPKVSAWEGDVVFLIYDDIITEDVFRKALVAAGFIVGIGRFRPQNRGFYGRFTVESVRWTEDASDMFAAAE